MSVGRAGIAIPISQSECVYEPAVNYTDTKQMKVNSVKLSEKWVMSNQKMILGHGVWNLGRREEARTPFLYRPPFEV